MELKEDTDVFLFWDEICAIIPPNVSVLLLSERFLNTALADQSGETQNNP